MASNDSTTEFIQLLTSQQSQMYAYALSLFGNRQQAQDVMQETILILWRKADQFQPDTKFAAWMMKVAYYQVLDHRRKLNKQTIFIGDDEFLGKLAEQASEFSEVMEERQDALRACLYKLPDRQRDIVRRRLDHVGCTANRQCCQRGEADPFPEL